MSDQLNQIFSLLHPIHIEGSEIVFFDEDRIELECNTLFHAIVPDQRYNQDILKIIKQPVYEAEVINYRLDIMDDLMVHNELTQRLEESMPIIKALRFANEKRTLEENALMQTVNRISELALYVDFIQKLHADVADLQAALKSSGLLSLRERVVSIYNQPQFQNLLKELPSFQNGLESMKSVTIGLNLDSQLNPEQATIISVNEKKYKGSSSMVGKLFSGANEYGGISELYDSTSRIIKEKPALARLVFKELKELLKDALKPIRTAIDSYMNMKCQWIIELEGDLLFYVGAVKFIHKMRKLGLPMCRPTLLPVEQRACRLSGSYNINLAIQLSYKNPNGPLKEQIVANDVPFGEDGRIFILTGPNSGGKTTYAQAIGLTQVLMQSGMYVPCETAEISPVDGVYVCFKAEESPGFETGKLGGESMRIGKIIQHATSHSLILLNESLSSTSPGESFYLLKDIVSAFRILGIRAVIATHLHELANSIERINQEVEGASKLISMVAGMNDASLPNTGSQGAVQNRSFKVQPGPPQGSSYAGDIARQFGISLDQMVLTMRQRNVLSV
jgi:DNA mismatch repair protein MutS